MVLLALVTALRVGPALPATDETARCVRWMRRSLPEGRGPNWLRRALRAR